MYGIGIGTGIGIRSGSGSADERIEDLLDDVQDLRHQHDAEIVLHPVAGPVGIHPTMKDQGDEHAVQVRHHLPMVSLDPANRRSAASRWWTVRQQNMEKRVMMQL